MIMQGLFMGGVREATHDYYRYTRYGLKFVLAKAGVVDIQVYPQTCFWVMWTLKFNYQSARLIRGPWVMRKAIRLVLSLVWSTDQRLAPWLDKYWKCEEETAGYFVVAKKR